MKNIGLEKLAVLTVTLFLFANLLSLAALPQLKVAINNTFAVIALQTSQLDLVTSKMDDKDKHLLGILEREVLQQTIDFSRVQSWFPLASYFDLTLRQERLADSAFVADYLACKFGVTCHYND